MYRFNKLPKGYKDQLITDINVQKDFVKYLEKKFGITDAKDWYLVNEMQIRSVISMKISEVMEIVKKFYPDLNLNNFQFGNPLGSKKSQYTLKSMLNILFPDQEIVEEYRHTDLENLELDYYLPQLKIAFEYQVTISCYL